MRIMNGELNRWLLAVTLLIVWLMAMGQPRQHERWLRLSSAELAAMGQKDMRPGQPKDTALMCFTIVAGRYEHSMTRQQKAQCIDANTSTVRHLFSPPKFIIFVPKTIENWPLWDFLTSLRLKIAVLSYFLFIFAVQWN